jgi:hypothetical protein
MAPELPLHDMDQRHRALTPSIAGSYLEAATVCLHRHHFSPLEVRLLDSGREQVVQAVWKVPDQRTTDAWANVTDATEAGAYGCVIAGLEVARNMFAVRRAETGTGADYYIGPQGAGVDDLEDCLRLEVSGVSDGDEKAVTKRLLEKIQQAQRGSSSLPAIAGVVGFSAKLLAFRDVPEAL